MLLTTDRRKPIGRLAHGAATGWKAIDCPTCDDEAIASTPVSTIRGYQKARRKRRRDSTLRPLTAPLNPDEQRVERAVRTGISEARARVNSARLLRAIELRSADEIVASVPIEPIQGIFNPIDTVFRDRMVWSAEQAADSFNTRRAFTVVDPEVIRYAGLQAGSLINRMTVEQLAALRGAIVDAVAGQFTVDDTAKIIRSSIGLTERYRKAVEKNYFNVKAAAILAGRTERMASDLAERTASRYADRLVRSRARTIARTEINTAQNYGKQIGWEASFAEGTMAFDTMKEWRISSGACEVCIPLNGETVPVMSAFSSGDLMPPLHPNCRCTADIVSPMREFIQRQEQQAATAAATREAQATEAPAPTATPEIATRRGYAPGQFEQLPTERRDEHYEKFAEDMLEKLPAWQRERYRERGWDNTIKQRYRSVGESSDTYVNNGVTVAIRSGVTVNENALKTLYDNIDSLMVKNPKDVLIKIEPLSRNTFGKAVTGGNVMSLAPRTVDDIQVGYKEGTSEFDKGFKMPVRAEVTQNAYTLTHEWGHLLDEKTGSQIGKITKMRNRAVRDNPSAISRYGQTNGRETVAESFAEWHLTGGRTTNPLVRDIAREYGWK
jgi:SPP1 gp7 family putative phage head morphogenesis protein